MRNHCIICLILLTASVAAVETAAPTGAEVLTATDINQLIAQSATLTTSAQRYHFQQNIVPSMTGRSVQLAVTVSDVKPVTWRDQAQFSIEASNAEPAYRFEIYTTSDAALMLNVGDTAQLQAQVVGIRFGRNTVVALEQATLLP